MYSKAKIGGHPIHPMLVAFPVAFYTATLASLIAYQVTDGPFWFRTAIVANAAGLITAAVAAIPGAIDYLAGIPRGTPASTTARNHALLNVTALGLFVATFALIRGGWSGPIEQAGTGLVLSLLGVLATVGAGWFGWKLVQHHHVGVEPLSERELADSQRASRAEVETQRPPIGGQPRMH